MERQNHLTMEVTKIIDTLYPDLKSGDKAGIIAAVVSGLQEADRIYLKTKEVDPLEELIALVAKVFEKR